VQISEEVIAQAREAFAEYERVFIARIVRKEGARLADDPVSALLASDATEQDVLELAERLQRGAAELRDSVIVK